MIERPNFTKECDLLIIGGGINGAAIANIAAAEGLSVVLLEKGDFASGTSSKSSKLIHGGLRYLENFEFGLVHESLKERFVQLKNAPHLVKPLGFVIPVYRGHGRPLWMMRLGVFLYDLLSGRYCIKRHRALTPAQVIEMVPALKKEDLVGGVLYYDAQMDDARLCLENVLSARAKGAAVANYMSVFNFIKIDGKVVGVRAIDLLNDREVEIRGRKIVCAAGPWTNYMLGLENPSAKEKIRTTKGVHLIYRQQLSEHAILLQSKKDNRVFFVIPWMGQSLIGTTDTDYMGPPERAQANPEDIEYLLKETQRVFPTLKLDREEIVATFAGLRPLVREGGAPSSVSREHVIEETYSGMWCVMGGKYTTYRAIAVQCVSKILNKELSAKNTEYPLYGSGVITEKAVDVAQRYSIDPAIVEHLQAKYGTRYRQVLACMEKEPALKERICTCSPTIGAEIVYAIKSEMAATAEDIIWRRLGIGYLPCTTKKCREFINRYAS